MNTSTKNDDRLLNMAERDLVAQSQPPIADGLTKEELQAVGKRLREARDRSRRIASQQQREMRGKTGPRGAAPARDNTGSEAKTAVLVEALKRVTAALRKFNRPTAAQVLRKALEAKQAAVPQHPSAGPTASKGMRATVGKQRSVRMDPREVGRVSKANKVAQAKRDR
ncbi:MAG TPA: hypothetical protein VKI44_30840 [Acetobacteraceae bacterium]|nr:hypothetical protein [Acetobacteraceae bacterium]